MSSGETAYLDPRFRPTLWPGTAIPVPPLRPIPEAMACGDWIVWPFPPRNAWKEPAASPFVELPPDFYLRELMEVDPSDLEAATDLVRRYGWICGIDNDLPGDVELDKEPVRDSIQG